MSDEVATTLADVLRQVDPEAHPPDEASRPITGSALWWPGTQLHADPTRLVVCPPALTRAALESLVEQLRHSSPRAVVMDDASTGDLVKGIGGHTVATVPAQTYDPGAVIVCVDRLLAEPTETAVRRLASLQRSLSQALGAEQPLAELLLRLGRVCNATVAVVDRAGVSVHATGPLPVALIFPQISSTTAAAQQFSLGGWRGVAVRIGDVMEPDAHGGWLVAATRRTTFPEQTDVSAMHIAGTLTEVIRRISSLTREQEQAVRASLLDQAVALRPVRGDDELTRRITELGITFDKQLRVALLRPRSTGSHPGQERHLLELVASLRKTLKAASTASLVSLGDGRITLLMQCSDKDLRRLLVSRPDRFTGVSVGVGRQVREIGDIADSFHDAQLALRILRRRPATLIMTYEDFDVAPRLFADVGLEAMETWARHSLDPIKTRTALMEGLHAYFDHDQNVNAAAETLQIHHNSLRYRLAKIAELLQVDLKSPAVVATLFLALTAVELSQDAAPRPVPEPTDDSDASDFPTKFDRRGVDGGVVRAPHD